MSFWHHHSASVVGEALTLWLRKEDTDDVALVSRLWGRKMLVVVERLVLAGIRWLVFRGNNCGCVTRRWESRSHPTRA